MGTYPVLAEDLLHLCILGRLLRVVLAVEAFQPLPVVLSCRGGSEVHDRALDRCEDGHRREELHGVQALVAVSEVATGRRKAGDMCVQKPQAQP